MAKPYTHYSPEIAEAICSELADGRTLRAICKDKGMPSEAAVRTWALDDVDGFFERYDRARKIGCDSLADELEEVTTGAAPEMAPLLRIKSDNRKWYLAMIAPRRFGDRSMIALPNNVRRVTFDVGDLALPEYLPSPKMIEGEYHEVTRDE